LRLRLLLTNVLYTGAVAYKGVVYAGEHPAIIDQQIWEAVNAQLGLSRARQRGRSPRRQNAWLEQLLYCGECGGAMIPTGTVKDGHRYRYYVCKSARQSRREACAQGQVAAVDLETSLIRHLEPVLGNQLSAPILQQAIERVTYEGAARRVAISLRGGTRSEYHLPEPVRQGVRRALAEGSGRIPRISRLMALAIGMEQRLREGSVANFGELAEVGQISLPRLSQILRLTDLAPSIQEQLLLLPPTRSGADAVTETDLRKLARVTDWELQQQQFRSLLGSRQPS